MKAPSIAIGDEELLALAERVRQQLLWLPEDQRADVLNAIHICLRCGADIGLPDGDVRVCGCDSNQ